MKTVLLNRIALVLAFAGIFISGILSVGARFEGKIPCGMSQGCEQVANHPSSRALFGIPNADIGLGVYVILAMLAFWRLASPERSRAALWAGYVLAALGTVASLVLTYVSFAVIKATCTWCLSSSATMVLLLIVHAILMQSEQPESSGTLEGSKVDPILLTVLLLGTGLALGVIGSNIAEKARTSGVNIERIRKADPKVILPDDAHVYGDPDAPVAIVEFADLQCGQCRTEFPKVRDYIGAHAGEVKYVFRHLPLIHIHQLAAPAAIAAEIAAEKGLFWQFVAAVYSDPKNIQDINSLLAVVEATGMDAAATLKRMQDKEDKAFKRVMRDLDDAGKLGVMGTPTFFIVAPGVPTRVSVSETLYDDLNRPEYGQFIKSGSE